MFLQHFVQLVDGVRYQSRLGLGVWVFVTILLVISFEIAFKIIFDEMTFEVLFCEMYLWSSERHIQSCPGPLQIPEKPQFFAKNV